MYCFAKEILLFVKENWKFPKFVTL